MADQKKRKNERVEQILTLLANDARMQLTTISKELGIPTSTVFDYMKEIRQGYQFTIQKKL
ncbi:MAG: winged helix-turn-helix transcriptional regulator [Candidatus Nanoarchaeia archaeon]